jgi:hypothetical protein
MTTSRVRRFARHYAEMVVAMIVGMVVLAPVWRPLAIEREDLEALVMAFDMTLGMAAWMWLRGHGARAVAEMSAAMVVPFLLLLGPLWAGLLSGHDLMMLGHVLMLASMLGVLLLRPDEYACAHPGRTLNWRPRTR